MFLFCNFSHSSVDELSELVGNNSGCKPDGDIEAEVGKGKIMQLPEGSPLRSRFIHRIFPSTSFPDGLRIVSEGEKAVLDIIELASCFQHLHPKIVIFGEKICLIATHVLNGAPSIHSYGMIDRATMLAILINVLRLLG